MSERWVVSVSVTASLPLRAQGLDEPLLITQTGAGSMVAMTETAGSATVADVPDTQDVDDSPWVTIVWDDPVNLMSYVTHVFVTYFHYSREKAEKLMMQVHSEGKAIVSSGGREAMERDCNAMHGFGLWATLDKAE